MNFAFPNRKMAASKQQESKEEDFNYKTKYKAYKRRLKLLVYVSATGVGLVTVVLKYLCLIRCTLDLYRSRSTSRACWRRLSRVSLLSKETRGVVFMLSWLHYSYTYELHNEC